MTYLITFHTNFDATAFLRLAKQLGNARMKPVPRQLSSSCGTCILLDTEDKSNLDMLTEKEFEKFYRITNDGFELLFEND